MSRRIEHARARARAREVIRSELNSELVLLRNVCAERAKARILETLMKSVLVVCDQLESLELELEIVNGVVK